MEKPSSPTYKIIRRNGGGCAVRIDTPNEKPVIVSGFQSDREAQAWIDRPGFSPRQSPSATSWQKSIGSTLADDRLRHARARRGRGRGDHFPRVGCLLRLQ